LIDWRIDLQLVGGAAGGDVGKGDKRIKKFPDGDRWHPAKRSVL